MTKRMFSSKSRTRAARPALLQEWLDGSKVSLTEPPNQNESPPMIPREHPHGLGESLQDRVSLIKRTTSKRDKDHPVPRIHYHISKPSIGASSHIFSTSSTEFTQIIGDNRCPDTDSETSPSSTLPRDLPTPVRTSYASKRAGMGFTSTSILLPTVYQPPTISDMDVDINSLPSPPFDPYYTNPNLNPRVNSPIPFQHTNRGINTAMNRKPEEKEVYPELDRIPGAERPRKISQSAAHTHVQEHPKEPEQLNDDFQRFLARSRSQARARNSVLSNPFQNRAQGVYNTLRASKVLDDFTFNHHLKASLSRSQSQSHSHSQPPSQPHSHTVKPASNSTRQATTDRTPQLNPQSRFSLDSRPLGSGSASSSLYGKMKGYIFPTRSRPTSAYSSRGTGGNVNISESETAAREKCSGKNKDGYGSERRSGRWSKVGRSIKRSLSIDRDKENDARTADRTGGGEYVTDTDDMGGGTWGKGGKRGGKIMPTSRGLNRYNRTVNGGYWT